MKLHKFCSLFPQASADEIQSIAENMRKHGYDKAHPLITFNGELLDGQNRQAAAEIARVKPVTKPFKGTEAEALDFVIRENFDRRHLSQGQRAMIAVEIAKLKEAGTSDAKIVKASGVSHDTFYKAKRIKKEKPALAKKVQAGKITLNAATKKLPPLPPRRALNFEDVYTSSKKPTPAAPAASEPPKEKRSLGQIAYETYAGMMAETLGAPSWDHEGEKSQKAWEAAAKEILKHKA